MQENAAVELAESMPEDVSVGELRVFPDVVQVGMARREVAEAFAML